MIDHAQNNGRAPTKPAPSVESGSEIERLRTLHLDYERPFSSLITLLGSLVDGKSNIETKLRDLSGIAELTPYCRHYFDMRWSRHLEHVRDRASNPHAVPTIDQILERFGGARVNKLNAIVNLIRQAGTEYLQDRIFCVGEFAPLLKEARKTIFGDDYLTLSEGALDPEDLIRSLEIALSTCGINCREPRDIEALIRRQI